MDKIIEDVESLGVGYRMSNNRKVKTSYRELFKFYQACQQLNMNISAEKTISITIAKDPIRYKLVVEDKPIEQLTHFKYLSVDLSSYDEPVRVLRGLISKAAVISDYLRNVV